MNTNNDLRRVAAAEVLRRTGWGGTWLRTQIERGRFPPPLRDPGGRRRWWLSSDVDAALLRLAAEAQAGPSGRLALAGAELRARAASAGHRTAPEANGAHGPDTPGHTTGAPAARTQRRGSRRSAAT